MENNFRITFSDGSMGNKSKHVDVYAQNSDDAFSQAYKMPETEYGIYTDVSVEEIPTEPTVIGIQFRYTDTYMKKDFTGYVIIRAKDEAHAKEYYNEQLKGKHFMHYPSKLEESGKCVIGKIVETYFAACPGFDYDAMEEK